MRRLARSPGLLGTSDIQVILVTLAVLLGGPQASAQEARESQRTDPEAALARLEAGQRLRVELMEGARETGRYRNHVGDSLRMHDGAVVTIAMDDLRKVWTRGNNWKTGALVGGGVGLVAGAVVGAWLGDFACAEGGEDCTLEAALALGGIGAAGGAGLGAVAGLLIPRWDQQWP